MTGRVVIIVVRLIGIRRILSESESDEPSSMGCSQFGEGYARSSDGLCGSGNKLPMILALLSLRAAAVTLRFVWHVCSSQKVLLSNSR